MCPNNKKGIYLFTSILILLTIIVRSPSIEVMAYLFKEISYRQDDGTKVETRIQVNPDKAKVNLPRIPEGIEWKAYPENSKEDKLLDDWLRQTLLVAFLALPEAEVLGKEFITRRVMNCDIRHEDNTSGYFYHEDKSADKGVITIDMNKANWWLLAHEFSHDIVWGIAHAMPEGSKWGTDYFHAEVNADYLPNNANQLCGFESEYYTNGKWLKVPTREPWEDNTILIDILSKIVGWEWYWNFFKNDIVLDDKYNEGTFLPEFRGKYDQSTNVISLDAYMQLFEPNRELQFQQYKYESIKDKRKLVDYLYYIVEHPWFDKNDGTHAAIRGFFTNELQIKDVVPIITPTPTPTPMPTQFDGEDNFSRIKNMWRNYEGSWKIKNGKLATDGGDSVILANDIVYKDFTFTSKIKFKKHPDGSINGNAGIVWWAKGSTVPYDDYFNITIDPTYDTVTLIYPKGVYGGWKYDVDVDVEYKIKLVTFGENIKFYINDELVIDIDINANNDKLTTSGQIGFRTYYCPAEVDNVKVTPNYTITFDTQGGNKISSKKYQNMKITVLPAPTRSGYTFKGWYESKTKGTKLTVPFVNTVSKTLYAQWIITKPDVPKSPKAAAVSKAEVKISWEVAGDVTAYVIYRSDKKDGTFTKIATIKDKNVTSYNDVKLATKTTYYYKIRSYVTVDGVNAYSPYTSVFSGKTK